MATRQVPDFSHLMATVQIGKYTCPNRVKYAACSGPELAPNSPVGNGAVPSGPPLP